MTHRQIPISIHAPAQGATHGGVYSLPPCNFNPRTRTGCDAGMTHYYLTPGIFQSTHPHRVRLYKIQDCPWDQEFQSTHPHRVRHQVAIHRYIHHNFNPRTRTGCDAQMTHLLHVGKNFNPRTRTGCDNRTVLNRLVILSFQSTHPHRVRRIIRIVLSDRRLFQSTHPHRVRPSCQSRRSVRLLFQSTHPHRVRHDIAPVGSSSE